MVVNNIIKCYKLPTFDVTKGFKPRIYIRVTISEHSSRDHVDLTVHGHLIS